jgi:hypothetical protein
LLDDGNAAIAYYKTLGVDNGWEVVDQSAPSRNADSEGRRADLVLTKRESGRVYSFGVSIGRSVLHDEVEVGAHGSVLEPSMCS